MSLMPPILRGEDVGAGFASELLTNAYNFMNSIVDSERRAISAVFSEIFQEKGDYTILPSIYNPAQPEAVSTQPISENP
jgi:hypothetical protein